MRKGERGSEDSRGKKGDSEKNYNILIEAHQDQKKAFFLFLPVLSSFWSPACCLLLPISIIIEFFFFVVYVNFCPVVEQVIDRLLICGHVSTYGRIFRITSTCVEQFFIFVFFHLRNIFFFSISIEYVPNVGAPRGVYRSSYVRPRTGYGYRGRLPPPVVPAGRAPGGAGLLAAILGPIGGLTGCLCCLNTIGIWGLFITAIPLTVFISKSSSYRCHWTYHALSSRPMVT